MKTGMVLYVTEGKEDVPLPREEDMIGFSQSLGVASVCVAITEEDVAYGWWRLIAKGVHEVLFMPVAYDVSLGSLESRGTALRLWG